MPPKAKGQNAANPYRLRVQLRRSIRRNNKTSTTIRDEVEDGPERFAPWYPLLQKVRRDNRNQQQNQSSGVPLPNENLHQAEQGREEALPDVLKHLDLSLSVSPKVFVNQLAPPGEYPVVQLRNGVLMPALSKEPKNLMWLQTRLKAARDVSDWTTSKWHSYMMHSYLGTTKEAIMFEMMPLFQEFPNEPEYIRTFCQRFDDFPEYAPFSLGIEKPCPSFAQGFIFEGYAGIDIEYLCAAVCFARDHASLVLPQIVGDFTCGDVRAAEATSARHGAALVYMRNMALAHSRTQDLDDTAEVMTFVTNGMSIHFYAHYSSITPEGKVKYHQYPVLSVNLVGSYTEFLQGITMLRNCQEHALSVSTRLRDTLVQYHAQNGVNAWAYHLNDGDHILSESEDSVIDNRSSGGRNDKVLLEKQDVASLGGIKGTAEDPGKVFSVSDGSSDDEEGDGMDDADGTDYEDDSPPPTPRQAPDPIKLRPKRRAAQIEAKMWSSPRKRRAGKNPGEEPPRKRRG
ncbi:hypothetical protein TARUN_1290 [Trichoderma arundinaceum]|uniref:Uncharacterized protein n=1 Tax=Trichoderma arundinaceum TaxID=490622 RepID=A0A395NXX9_TRIAR|nr:hypothetical protein TARUN_1290 [Trichoderma arundinaceum]